MHVVANHSTPLFRRMKGKEGGEESREEHGRSGLECQLRNKKSPACIGRGSEGGANPRCSYILSFW